MADDQRSNPEDTPSNGDSERPDSSSTEYEDEPELDEWWTWGNFARLFIFPLVLVVVAVAIYGTFQMMVGRQQSVHEYIATIQSGSQNQRWRAAYDLAQQVQLHGKDREFSYRTAQSIIELYRTVDDPRVRAYLALVLAKLPTDESRRALEASLTDSADTVTLASVQALGEMEARESAPVIAELLEHPSSQVRLRAAYVIGSLGNRSDEVTDALKMTLEDPMPGIRLNGAIALARLGNNAGEDLLLEQLQEAARVPEDQRDQFLRHRMVNIMKALRHLRSPKAVPALRQISQGNWNTTVKKEAMKTLRDIRNASA